MRPHSVLGLLLLIASGFAAAEASDAETTTSAVSYGANPDAGQTFTHDRV